MNIDVPELPAAAPKSRAAIEQTARWLLTAHYPDYLGRIAPIPVAEFAEFDMEVHYGFQLVVTELTGGLEAVTYPRHRTLGLAPDVYEALLSGDGRARFTTAHEIGHLFLHSDSADGFESGTGPPLYRKGQLPAYRDPEWQADSFAASFLMPIATVQEFVRRMGTDEIRMSVALGVSRMAARIRGEVLSEAGEI